MANNFSANLVISPKGSILAVDIVDPGSGYTNTPIITLNNPGGYGNGAILLPIMKRNPEDILPFDINGCGNPSNNYLPDFTSPNNKTVWLGGGGYAAEPTMPLTSSLIPVERQQVPEGKSIEKIVVIDAGVGYLQKPNGATGAGGKKFSNPEDTIVFCGGYNVYPPCRNVRVKSGNLVYLPFSSVGQIFNTDGELVQTIVGRGPVSPITVLEDGVLATPCIKREEVIPPVGVVPVSRPLTPTTASPTPTTASPTPTTTSPTPTTTSPTPTTTSPTPTTTSPTENTYNVALEIGDIFIANSGINYSPDDVITIEPSNGAILEPKFDILGRVNRVKVISPGIGFTELPKIRIYSDTGYNASLIPIFNVIRITEEVLDQDIVPPGTPIISVVDCVGIQPPKREFDIVGE